MQLETTKRKIFEQLFSLLNCPEGKSRIYLHIKPNKLVSGAILCGDYTFPIKHDIPVLIPPSARNKYHKLRAAYESLEPSPWRATKSDWIKHMREIHLEGIRRVYNLLKSRKKLIVLALGCGWGWEIWAMKKIFRDNSSFFIGIDLARKPLMVANHIRNRNNYYDVLFSVGNVEALPFKDQTFDVVTAIFGALDHIKNFEKAFMEVSRILKPGGVFLFTVLNKFSLDWIFKVIKNPRLFIKTIKKSREKFVRITIPTPKGKAYRILTHFYHRWELLKLLNMNNFKLIFAKSIFSILPANFKKRKLSKMEKILSYIEKKIGSKMIIKWLGRYILAIAIKTTKPP